VPLPPASPDVSIAPAAEVPASALTVAQALDFLFAELKSGAEPMLTHVERELVARALHAENQDEAKAAKLLGVSKAALQKLKSGE
jgi:transcriptional regulator with PAS, ATPase and Fis domain